MGKYRVVWLNTTTGESGHGEPIEWEEAISWRDKGNRDYPYIKHMVEPVKETEGGE